MTSLSLVSFSLIYKPPLVSQQDTVYNQASYLKFLNIGLAVYHKQLANNLNIHIEKSSIVLFR
jgi:hypothetical protein